MPGRGLLGPGPSPQQAVASVCGLSDSSKVMTSAPSFWNAGDAVMRGTQVRRNWSALTSPPG